MRVSPIAWAIAPAALLFILFFILPFAVMAVLSFLSGNPVSNPNVSFTWRHYNRLVASDLYFDALVATMRKLLTILNTMMRQQTRWNPEAASTPASPRRPARAVAGLA